MNYFHFPLFIQFLVDIWHFCCTHQLMSTLIKCSGVWTDDYLRGFFHESLHDPEDKVNSVNLTPLKHLLF